MKRAKSVAELKHRTSGLTARTFVGVTCLANLLTVVILSIELLAMAVVFRDGDAFSLGLDLIPLTTLIIWMAAAVLGPALLLPTWLREQRHYAVLRARRWIDTRTGVWDDWLDGPGVG
jgi:hypothetical protein